MIESPRTELCDFGKGECRSRRIILICGIRAHLRWLGALPHV